MDGMELIRELDVPETAGLANHRDPDFKSGTSPVALSEPAAPFVDLDAYLTRRELVFHQLRQPTYAEATVTGLTKGVGDVPEWSATGRGQSFGGVIHKGLEAVGRGLSMTELPVYVQYVCQNEGVADKDAADALSMMQEVLASELWRLESPIETAVV
ncbi:hypothetical protein LJK87_24320 [Paenibacillus sp. P25]|nr:hypothetical protein LJK87_24320 [Paenibacillus sp. P25]